MMDEPVPIGTLHDLLLPAELRIELCITDLTVGEDGKVLRFRLDPGRAYARRGYIRDADGSYTVGIYERYLPHDKPAEITGTHGLPLADVPDELRAASGRAYDRLATKPHWKQACPPQTPEWNQNQPSLTTAATLRTAETARRQAITTGQVIYVTATEAGFTCCNNPPPGSVFLSVTYEDQWSLHTGSFTYPVEGTPNASVFFTLQDKTSFPAIRFPTRPARIGGDGARLSAIDLTALRPEAAAYRGPGSAPPGRNGRTP